MAAVVPAPYRVLRRLSRTLYGGIYLCEDARRAETPVVIKRIELLRAIELLNSPETRQHSVDDPRHEKALANLLQRSGGHPNIVTYHSSSIVGSELFFVMEYCDGGDLFECIQRQERPIVDPMEALAVVAQVSAGVSFLHHHGFAHRDLSLENIFLDRGICKIGDFGLSTRTHELSQVRVGKAYYMAPEVVRGEQYDAKIADMWSIGIVLFIMLTGFAARAACVAEQSRVLQRFAASGSRPCSSRGASPAPCRSRSSSLLSASAQRSSRSSD
ncbi:hypothetical protein PINS_up018464 [Pythium insidiosum]|nr:hypothetical protein PINS_up018464 [Pythium insidiosum]